MCGRFACLLDPGSLCAACQHRSSDGTTLKTPKWINNHKIPEYHPSPNIAPTNYAPVLVSSKHFPADLVDDDAERIIEPMKFGMIPSWHKGEEKDMHLSTINCRLDGILTKRTYAGPLKKGRRCVVLAEGFYEWDKDKQEKNGQKQPYLIYLKESQSHYFAPKDSETPVDVKLLNLAAVFDIWHPKDGGVVYSFSIITTNSSEPLSWIHDRMPAILTTDEDVQRWLDFENVSTEDALRVLRPVDELAWHPVTRSMGNAGYKELDAVVPVANSLTEKHAKPLAKGQTTMTAFFPKKNKSAELETRDLHEPTAKKPKTGTV